MYFTLVIRSGDTKDEKHAFVFAHGDRSYFGEVTNNVRSMFVDFSEDVEDKGLDVKVQRLVVEE